MCPFINKIKDGVCVNLRNERDTFIVQYGEQVQIENASNIKIKLKSIPSALTCEVNVPEASGAFRWTFQERMNQYYLVDNEAPLDQCASLFAMISNLRVELNGRL